MPQRLKNTASLLLGTARNHRRERRTWGAKDSHWLCTQNGAPHGNVHLSAHSTIAATIATVWPSTVRRNVHTLALHLLSRPIGMHARPIDCGSRLLERAISNRRRRKRRGNPPSHVGKCSTSGPFFSFSSTGWWREQTECLTPRSPSPRLLVRATSKRRGGKCCGNRP